MTKVVAISAPDAASDPLHPDHDRWVKDRTLKMEVDHQMLIGGTIRAAEVENQRMLNRSEQLAKAAKAKPAKAPPPRKPRDQRLHERAVKISQAMPRASWKETSPCGRCGLCRGCKREKRIFAIGKLVKQEPWAFTEMMRLVLTLNKINAGAGEYRGVKPSDAQRKLVHETESICDRSVKFMGRWI